MDVISGITVAELAKRLGTTVQGDGDHMILGVNTLKDAGPNELSFLANPKYVDQVRDSRAGAILVHEQHAHLAQTALVSQNPYLDFARTVQMFAKPQGSFQGQSPLASIHPSATVDPSATIYPFVYVGARAEIGPETTLFSGVYVGEDSKIGCQCTLYPNSVIMAGTVLGNRVVLHPGAVAGSDGFGFAQGEGGIEKFPQVGRAVLNDDADIGANTTIDRAALGETRIGKGTKIDNLVQIGHNVTVGENCLIVAQVGIAGSTKIGDRVIMGGQTAVAGHIEVGSGCRMAAKTGLSKSLAPNSDVSGIPAMDHKTFLKVAVTLHRLPEMVRRLKALETELGELKAEKRQGEDGGE